MRSIRPSLSPRAEARLQGRLKLAKLLSMPEEEFAGMVKGLESNPAFRALVEAGVVARSPLPAAAFAARRFAGLSLTPPREGLGELLDGDSRVVSLMRRVGRARLEAHFLSPDGLSPAERARRCGLAPEGEALLRGWLDRLYIRTEFEPAAPAPARVFSAVAGIEIAGGTPVLRFFNRDVWAARYQVDARLGQAYLSRLTPAGRAAAEACLKRLEVVNRRKTSLYRVLEELLRLQAEYLQTGDPARRRPLTQRSLAVALDLEPSSLNRLVSNKSVELPWGVEAPLKVLLPSAKRIALEAVASLAHENPRWTDERLRAELARRLHIHLSRRSVAQYRQDLGMAPRRPPRAPRSQPGRRAA